MTSIMSFIKTKARHIEIYDEMADIRTKYMLRDK